ncbi:hypothetical protein HYALB_00007209 [Hymenoscyphus albidus]|uniref:MULE transposase domain-containing protein n=1 Tax=Hymenoscyphus albidus TaxID=595503 RepID=A0A9N9Q1I8_9HELO|nr:hypothetical protein HYALB_00007209 [Hymenoscyphus albidus]
MDVQLSLSPLPLHSPEQPLEPASADATPHTSMPLPPEAIYSSKEELYTSIQAWAAHHCYAFRIGRSTKIHGGPRTKITYNCDRYGLPPSEKHPQQHLQARIKPSQAITYLRQITTTPLQPYDIYNLNASFKREQRHGLSPNDALIQHLTDNKIHFKINVTSENRTQHLFIAYPQSIQLAQTNQDVVLVDNTYKTNKFQMPLLHMIGVTSSGLTFSIGFCFLPGETQEDFIWGFQCFQELGINPGAIVIDGDQAQKNASEEVFPHAPTLLCIWHVNQCVLAKCKNVVGEEDWKAFEAAWRIVIQAQTIEQFDKRWLEFQTQYSNPKTQQCVAYLQNEWLKPGQKERLVEAWTNQYLHFGIRVTSRAEGAHAYIKRYLGGKKTKGDLYSSWLLIEAAVINQITAVSTRISMLQDRAPLDIDKKLYQGCFGVVTWYALRLVQRHQETVSRPLLPCTGAFTRAMGLPCAHICEIKKDTTGLTPSDFHEHWYWDRKSTIQPLLNPLWAGRQRIANAEVAHTGRILSKGEKKAKQLPKCSASHRQGHTMSSLPTSPTLSTSPTAPSAPLASAPLASLAPTVPKQLSPDRPEVLILAYLAEKTAWLAQHPTIRPAEYRKARKWKTPRPKILKEQVFYMPRERRDLTGTIITNKADWTNEEIIAWLDNEEKKEQDEYNMLESEFIRNRNRNTENRSRDIWARLEEEYARDSERYIL